MYNVCKVVAKSIDGWVEEERAKVVVVGGEKKRTLVLYLSVKSVQPSSQEGYSILTAQIYREDRRLDIYIYRIQGGIATSETMGRHKFIIFSETYLIRYLFISISKKKWRDKFSGRARNLKLIISQIYLNLGKINFSFFFFLIHP